MANYELEKEIRELIDRIIRQRSQIVIYPFGFVGRIVKRILNEEYSITELCLIDNGENSDYNIKPISELEFIKNQNVTIILASTNTSLYFELKESLQKYEGKISIAELPSMKYFADRCSMIGKRIHKEQNPDEDKHACATKGMQSYLTKKAEKFVVCPKDICSGCGCCVNACPRGILKLIADEEGFVYPEISDEEKCNHCRLCVENCPVLNSNKIKGIEPQAVYAAYSNDAVTRYMSTSGGAFSEFADYIFRMSGVCYGAAYTDEFAIKHIRIDRREDLWRIRQSKYYQSDMSECYPLVKSDLEEGRYVLFSGTPCQCAGISKYLGKKFPKLIMVDLICHSVCSPKAFQAFRRDIEQLYGRKVRRVWFKNKETTWNRFSLRMDFEDTQDYYREIVGIDDYFEGFLRYKAYLRPSCHDCSFKGYKRCSDITLADFWGLKWKNKGFGDIQRRNGVSEIILNTSKAVQIFEDYVKYHMYVEEHDFGEIHAANPGYFDSILPGEYRDYFFDQVEKKPFHQIINAMRNAENKGESDEH